MATQETYNTIDCKERLLWIEKNSGYGGYKQELLDKDLNEMQIEFYVCNKCHGVMRNACLIQGSDQILACKLCLSIEESSISMVKSTNSIVKLPAKCPLVNRGCAWNGILGEIDSHLDECTEFILSCSNKCGVILKRSKLQNHRENECQLRKVRCQYCGATMRYKTLENHYKNCVKFLFPCPNICMKGLIREDIESHIENECPNTQVPCPYKEMGCEILSKRSELQKHEKTYESKHFDISKVFYSETVQKLESKVRNNDSEIEQLTTKVQSIEREYQQFKLSTDAQLTEQFKITAGANKAGSSPMQKSEQKKINNEAEKVRAMRANLEIRYQLFSIQKPEEKRIGPLNSNQITYCDLVNIICSEERNGLRKNMTIELYTCEGYPLATRPISYISKLSDWCLEEYPDTPLLYAVPRLKCYTDKCTQYMTTAPLCDGIDHIFIRNTECDFKRTIQTNCSEATYFQLVKTIQDMTGIPGHLIQLYQADKHVHSDEASLTLNKLNIGNQSVLTMELNDHFWTLGKDKNFSLQECKPTWHQEQSSFGTSFFFSCLYSLADWMAEPDQRSSGVFYQTLGHIRSITGCPPLIHALNIMFRNETLTLPHRVAIQECLVMLFKTIEPKNRKLHIPGFEIINTKKVTEFSNYFWVYLIHYSNKSHLQTEKYSTLNLTCSVTFKRMTDPVVIMDPNGVKHIVDRNILYDEDRDLVKYLYNYKRMIHSFVGDEAIIWNFTTASTCGVYVTDKWENLTDLCLSFPALSIQTPLNINNTCHRPSMIPLASGDIGVYLFMSQNRKKPFIYYEVTTGKYKNFDVQELDLAVKSSPPFYWDMIVPFSQVKQTIANDPEEIIMVILDTGESMRSCYLEGESSFDLALEGFRAFCDRTRAYELRNLIGLTCFANTCMLKDKFSVNLQRSICQLRDYPVGSSSVVYDAIKFAVDQLNKFTTECPEYKDIPQRVLCLTCGSDNHSKITPKRATRLLVDNGIKMDCILLSNTINTVDTHAIAKASGGYSFKPTNSREMLSIFEQETMLSMKFRQHCNPSFLPSESIDLMSQVTLSHDTEPSYVLTEKLNTKFQTIQKYLSPAFIQKQFNAHSNNLLKKIIQELSYYQANPHPAFEVFPGEEHIDFWRIIMEGPEGTPYEGGIFELFIEFINEYPSKPPNIRFITPIYHCNINSSGRICHTILDKFYAPGVRVGEIFNHVYGLLSSPEEQDPLDSVKANMLRFDKENYFREAKNYTDCHANIPKSTVRIKLLGGEKNVQLNYPEHLVCPLTLQLFEDPVATLSGDTYEREAILEHLNSGKNYDPFTFRELHINELRPNKLIQKSVSEYKKQVAAAAKS